MVLPLKIILPVSALTIIAIVCVAVYRRVSGKNAIARQWWDLLIILVIIDVLSILIFPRFWPNYQKFKMQEAKVNLNFLARLQAQYHASHGTYAKSLKDLGWYPLESRRYCIYLGDSEFMPSPKCPDRASATSLLSRASIPHPPVTDSSFTAIAIGDIDLDDGLDVWVITEKDFLMHERDDVFMDDSVKMK